MVLLALSRAQRDGSRRAAGAAEQRAVRLAARHAVERRRLGGVRRRQQLGVPERRAVRRSQRDARSDLPRYHRPRARSAGRVRAATASIRRCGAASNIWCAPRKPTEAGTGAGASTTSTARSFALRGLQRRGRRRSRGATSCAPANGCAPFRMPTAAGAKAAPATTTTASSPAAEHAVANRLGDSGLARRRRHHQQQRAPGHRISDGNAAARRRLGRRAGHRHRISRASSICTYHLYRHSFPVLALSELPEDEKFAIDGADRS